MRKILILALLLLIFQTGTPLKSSALETVHVFNKTFSDDDLVKRLSENKNFANFILRSIDFEIRIRKSNSSDLLRKIVEKKATETDISRFSTNLGYSSFEDIKREMAKLSDLANKYKREFPEINEIKDSKALLIKAARMVISRPENKQKLYASFLPIEEEECWASFAILLTLCWNLYYIPGDYNGYFICLGVADAWLAGCLIGAN